MDIVLMSEYKKHCEYCDKEFVSCRRDQRVCSDVCRVKLWRRGFSDRKIMKLVAVFPEGITQEQLKSFPKGNYNLCTEKSGKSYLYEYMSQEAATAKIKTSRRRVWFEPFTTWSQWWYRNRPHPDRFYLLNGDIIRRAIKGFGEGKGLQGRIEVWKQGRESAWALGSSALSLYAERVAEREPETRANCGLQF